MRRWLRKSGLSEVNLRLRVLIPTGVILAGVLISSILALLSMQRRHFEHGLGHVTATTRQAVSTRIADDVETMGAALIALASDESMQSMFSRGDREGLLRRAAPVFRVLRDDCRVTHFYFHGLDLKCFLRVHRPDRYGDLITRPSLARAVATEQRTAGLESGPLGTFALRVVQPWTMDGRVIGYLELGEEIDHVSAAVTGIVGADVRILVGKETVDRDVWERGVESGAAQFAWDTVDRYLVVGSPRGPISRQLIEVVDRLDADPVGRSEAYSGADGRRWAAFLSFDDLEGRRVGVILVDHDVQFEFARTNRIILISVLISGALLAGLGLTAFLLLGRLERVLAGSRARAKRQHRLHVREMAVTQASTAASEARYRGLFERTSDAVMILSGETFVECNAATLRMFRCSGEDEFLHKHPWDLSPELQADGETSREVAARHMDRVVRDGSIRFEWVHRRLDGELFDADVLLNVLDIEGQPSVQAVVRDIGARKRAEKALRDNERRFRAIAQAAQDAIVLVDGRGRVLFWNPAAETIFGHTAEEMAGRNVHDVLTPDQCRPVAQANLAAFAGCGRGGAVGRTVDLVAVRKDGREFPVELSLASIEVDDGWHAVAVVRDVSERRALERSMVHAQKMESIGQLAAGVAHEINTPTQFVGDNLRFLSDAFDDLSKVVVAHDRLRDAARAEGLLAALVEAATAVREEADVDDLLEEIPGAIAQSLDGLERTATIVRALKEFSHPDAEEMALADLNRAIESTVTMARNEWRYTADLVTDLDPGLPPVRCWIGDVNQVVLNLVVNASHAIADVLPDSGDAKGTITVRTRLDGDSVEIRVSDTGAGIPEGIRNRVFDPFFTTKDVGRGTGQGLSLAYDVVVNKHAGSIAFETEEGRGTTFVIRLPVGPHAAGDEEAAIGPADVMAAVS